MADIIDHSLYNTLPSLEKAEAALEVCQLCATLPSLC